MELGSPGECSKCKRLVRYYGPVLTCVNNRPNLLEDKQLFSAQDSNGEGSSLHHMAEMVAVLGLPPLDYLQLTETFWKYFDDSGKWRGAVDIPEVSLENAGRLGGESKILFLDFMRKMLQWVPAKRYTANQLLNHPWLR